MSNAIEITDLKKTYSDKLEALRGISLNVQDGGFYGLLGPNGAGKSTTIGILCGLVNKTSGTVLVNGHDIDQDPLAAKLSLGVVPQEFNFNIFEQCWQIVVNQAGYYGVPYRNAIKRVDELFDKLGLMEKRNVPAGRLSGGLKRRLMIARALIHKPKILILDEPTAGVDISLRRSMWTFLEEINRSGTTIVLTTHYLEEAESLCKHIGIIDKGKLITNAETQSLLHQLQSETVVLYLDQPLNELPAIPGVWELKKVDERCLEATLVQSHHISELIQLLSQNGIIVDRIKNKANRLEELFVKLVKG